MRQGVVTGFRCQFIVRCGGAFLGFFLVQSFPHLLGCLSQKRCIIAERFLEKSPYYRC